METQAQSPPTPALHARQGEGGTRRGAEGLRGGRTGSPGANPRGRPLESRQAEVVGTQAQCQRHRGARGPLSSHPTTGRPVTRALP